MFDDDYDNYDAECDKIEEEREIAARQDFHYDIEQDPAYIHGWYDSSPADDYEEEGSYAIPVSINWEATTNRTFKQMIEYLNEIRAEGEEPILTQKEIIRLYNAFIGTPTLTLKGANTPICTKSYLLYNGDESMCYYVRDETNWHETKWKDYGAVPNVELDYRVGETLEEHLEILEDIDTDLETKVWQGDPSALEELALQLQSNINGHLDNIQDFLDTGSFLRMRANFFFVFMLSPIVAEMRMKRYKHQSADLATKDPEIPEIGTTRPHTPQPVFEIYDDPTPF